METKTSTLIIVAIVLAIVAGVLLKISHIGLLHRSAVNPNEQTGTVSAPTPEPKVGDGCAVGGCSGEICAEVSEAGQIVSSCVYLPEFACYKKARCEKQADGKCGWTQTAELKTCISAAPKIEVQPMSD